MVSLICMEANPSIFGLDMIKSFEFHRKYSERHAETRHSED